MILCFIAHNRSLSIHPLSNQLISGQGGGCWNISQHAFGKRQKSINGPSIHRRAIYCPINLTCISLKYLEETQMWSRGEQERPEVHQNRPRRKAPARTRTQDLRAVSQLCQCATHNLTWLTLPPQSHSEVRAERSLHAGTQNGLQRTCQKRTAVRSI